MMSHRNEKMFTLMSNTLNRVSPRAFPIMARRRRLVSPMLLCTKQALVSGWRMYWVQSIGLNFGYNRLKVA